jgi:hypothetical protein
MKAICFSETAVTIYNVAQRRNRVDHDPQFYRHGNPRISYRGYELIASSSGRIYRREKKPVPIVWVPMCGMDVVTKRALVENRTSVDQPVSCDYRLSYPGYRTISYLLKIDMALKHMEMEICSF